MLSLCCAGGHELAKCATRVALPAGALNHCGQAYSLQLSTCLAFAAQVDVNGPSAHPVWRFLLAHQPANHNYPQLIDWNFNK